jgi:acetolactate synthase-1/2/3 large subunit
MSRHAMEKYESSDGFIEVMNAYGVEHIFFNPGIDNVPILEALSKYSASGRPAPNAILCLDEFLAMTAAHGNYMASGRPQVVLVHSELGTQQVGGAMHNAQWGRVPVIFCAEPLGPPGRTNWRGEPADQGSMVRNCVKWDHQLGDHEDIRNVVQKAFKTATTDPCGPVYLVFPRDTYWRQIDKGEKTPTGVFEGPASIPKADETLLGNAAEMLLSAQDPLIITGYAGMNAQTVDALVALAEVLRARVLAADIWMNFPNTHPLFACLDPDAGVRKANPYLTTADVILFIDYDMHYAAPPTVPAADAKIIHMDMDLKKRGQPLWRRRADIQIEADSSEAIPALNEVIQQRLTLGQIDRLAERFRRLESEHKKLLGKWHARAMGDAERRTISADWLCHCIDEVITDETVIVNQAITPSSSVVHQIERTKPGTLLSCAGGCIGWALGAGLGVKLAKPGSTVVSLMGDGAFIYGCPEATLWTASFYKAPFLSIIFNNQAYSAIKGLFRETYDVGNMGADITPPPDFARVAQACEAYGRKVEAPSEILPALQEAMGQVQDGRPAVLDVRIKQP